MKVYRILIGLLPLTLAAACGGDDGGDDDAPFVPLEELPAGYAESVCTAITNCAGVVLEVFLPGEDCVANNTRLLEEGLPDLQQAVDDGRVVYNGEQAAACAAGVKSADCAELQQRNDACEAAFTGSTALGESCTLDDECAGNAFCDFGATCPGTCRELGGEGGDCNNNADCVSGLLCSPVTQICQTPAGPGDLCGAADNPDCALGYLCVGGDPVANEPGNCRVYDEIFVGSEGDLCSPAQGQLCQTDLSCQLDNLVPPTWSCAAKVGSGEACRPGVPEQCPNDEYCNATVAMLTAGMMGMCEPRPGDGEPCAGISANICAAGHRCNGVGTGSTCKALTEVGGGCMVDAVCYSAHCLDGQCASTGSCE